MAAAVASRLPAHQIDNTWPVAVWLDEGIRLHNHKAAGAIKYEQKYCENMLPRTAPSVKNPARNFARFCAGFQRRCYNRHPLRNRAGPMVGMDAFNSRFRRFRRLARDLLVVVAAITAVVAIVFLLNLWLTDPTAPTLTSEGLATSLASSNCLPPPSSSSPAEYSLTGSCNYSATSSRT